MAEQKLQPGFTPISNQLLERIIQSQFTLRETKILFAVIRYTFGFNRQEAELSLRYLSNAANIKYRHTQSTVANLISKNILLVKTEATSTQSRVIQININFNAWNLSQDNNFSQSNVENISNIKSDVTTELVNTPLDQKSITNVEPETTEKVSYGLTEKVSPLTTKKVSKKENINKALKKTISDFPQIPDELLEIPGFTDIWQNWITHRKEIKKPLTAMAVKLQFDKLLDLRNKGSDVVELISTAIRNGWQGIWEVNNNGGNYNGRNTENKASVKSRLNYKFDPDRYEQRKKELIAQYG